jgi:hypothetical protein
MASTDAQPPCMVGWALCEVDVYDRRLGLSVAQRSRNPAQRGLAFQLVERSAAESKPQVLMTQNFKHLDCRVEWRRI